MTDHLPHAAITLDHLDLGMSAPANGQSRISIRGGVLTLSATTVADLIRFAADQAGVGFDGGLVADGIRLRLPIGPVRLPITIRVERRNDHHLELRPAGGLPGWFVGLAGRYARNIPGVVITRHGAITLNLATILERDERIVFAARLDRVEVSPDALMVRLVPK